MAVDRDYYYNTFIGTPYDDIDRLLARAERELNKLPLITAATPEQETAFMNAVCEQASFIGSNGGLEMWDSLQSGGNISSVGVEGFSVSFGSSSGASASGSVKRYAPDALEYLENCGLLIRAVTVLC